MMRGALCLLFVSGSVFGSACGVINGALDPDACLNNFDCESSSECFDCSGLCNFGGECALADEAFNDCDLADEGNNTQGGDFDLFLEPDGPIPNLAGRTAVSFVLSSSSGRINGNGGLGIFDFLSIRIFDDDIGEVLLNAAPGADGGEGVRADEVDFDPDTGIADVGIEVTIEFPDDGPPDDLNMVVQAVEDNGNASNSVCVTGEG